jgi:hypothetical protein
MPSKPFNTAWVTVRTEGTSAQRSSDASVRPQRFSTKPNSQFDPRLSKRSIQAVTATSTFRIYRAVVAAVA